AVEANLIGQGILLMVLIVQDMGLLRVKIGVGEAETPRLILLQVGVGDVAVGLLREPVDFDMILRSGELLGHNCLLPILWSTITHCCSAPVEYQTAGRRSPPAYAL